MITILYPRLSVTNNCWIIIASYLGMLEHVLQSGLKHGVATQKGIKKKCITQKFIIKKCDIRVCHSPHSVIYLGRKYLIRLPMIRAGKSFKMSERGILLGVKCPQSCVEDILQNWQLFPI